MATSKIKKNVYPFIGELVTTMTSGSYTPTKDCWVYILYNAPQGAIAIVSIDGKEVFRAASGAVQNVGYVSGNASSGLVPIKAGQTLSLTGSGAEAMIYSMNE